MDEDLRQRRREEILAVATDLFSREGFGATDLEVVAKQVGVGKGTIYRYFENKADLFLATVDDAMRRMDLYVQQIAISSIDPLEQMALAVFGYLEFFRRNPQVVELLIQERAVFRDHRKSTYFQHLERNTEPWKVLLDELITEGRVRQMPVERIVQVFSDMLYGTMFASFFAGTEITVEDHFRDILDVALRGVLSTSEQSRWSDEAVGRLVAMANETKLKLTQGGDGQALS